MLNNLKLYEEFTNTPEEGRQQVHRYTKILNDKANNMLVYAGMNGDTSRPIEAEPIINIVGGDNLAVDQQRSFRLTYALPKDSIEFNIYPNGNGFGLSIYKPAGYWIPVKELYNVFDIIANAQEYVGYTDLQTNSINNSIKKYLLNDRGSEDSYIIQSDIKI
jgi:hypothetical protein